MFEAKVYFFGRTMNKRCMLKVGAAKLGFIVAFALITSIFFILTTSATGEQVYTLEDKVKVNIEESGNYVMTIQTPEQTFLYKSNKTYFIFKPDFIGDYIIDIKGEDWKTQTKFKVIDKADKIKNKTIKIPLEEVIVNITTKNNNSIKKNNFTIKNLSNIIKSSNDTEENQLQEFVSEKIIAGEKVKWRKKVISNISEKILIPYTATNVTIIKNLTRKEAKIKSNIYNKINSIFSEETTTKEIILENDETATIEYETQAPTVKETIISNNKKEVIVSAPSYLNYENVLTTVNFSEIAKDKRQFKVYWKEGNQYLNFEVNDTNNNSLIDEISFIVPHLSTQTIEIIVINVAKHLDINKNFIEDIYDKVKDEDGIWSPVISNGEFVRITFEKELDWTKDITIIPRITSGNPIIEVYENNSNIKLSEFNPIYENIRNKIYLTNLVGKQDTFDLKIIGGSIEFDYIVDPQVIETADADTYTNVNNIGTTIDVGDYIQTTVDDNNEWRIGYQDAAGQVAIDMEATLDFDLSALNIPGSAIINMTVDYRGCWTGGTGADCGVTDLPEFDDGTQGEFRIYLEGANRELLDCTSPECQITNELFLGDWNTQPSWGSPNQENLFQYQKIGGFEDGDIVSNILTLVLSTTGTNFNINYEVEQRIDYVGLTLWYNDPSSIPTQITCDGTTCDKEVNESTTLQCSGSTDTENDAITYFLEARLLGGTRYNFSSYEQVGGFLPLILDSWGDTTQQGSATTVNWVRCMAGDYISTDNTVLKGIYVSSAGVGNARLAVYQGGTLSDPNGANLIWDAGTVAAGTGFVGISGGTQILSANLPTWICVKGNNDGFQVHYDSTYDATSDYQSARGRWVASGLSTDETVAYPATISGAGTSFSNFWYSFYLDYESDPSLIEENTTTVEYLDVSSDKSSISQLSVVVEVDSFNPSGSIVASNLIPDLFLEIYNGSSWLDIGAFDLNDFYNNTINTTNHNFTIMITDTNITTAWENSSNQDLRIKGINMDTNDSANFDEINFSNVDVNFYAKSWVPIGNHSDGSSFFWYTLNLMNQFGVDLRCQAIDLLGSGVSRGFYTVLGLLDILHNDIVPSVVTSITPTQDYVNDTSRKPEFVFNVTDDKDLNLTCNLWYQGTYLTLLGKNTNVANNSQDVIIPIQPMQDGVYEWWIGCDDGENEGFSEKRNLTILVGDTSGKAFVQAESGIAYLSGVSQYNVALNNSYNVAHAFIIPDSQMSASTNELPSNSDANFYFSNIVDGVSNQLTIQRVGTTGTMVGTYSILESEYMDVCHVNGSVANTIDIMNLDISSSCPFIPVNYAEKCFISVRNNVKSASTSNTCKGENDFMGSLTSQTNARFQAHTRACGSRDVMADIVCFNDETMVTPISTGEVHFNTGAIFPIGHAVNRSNSFLIQSCREEEYGLEDRNSECYFSDDSNILCRTSDVGTGGTAPQECEIYVVEFESDTYSSVTQHTPLNSEIGNNLVFTSDFTPEIDLNSSALFCSYAILNGEGTNNAKAEFPAYFVDNNTIGFERGQIGNQDPSHHFSCEVITFPTKKDPITVNLDSPIDGFADYDSDFVDLKFNASVTSTANLRNCNLWHNVTGFWHLNQTVLVGGRSANVEFWLYGLNNVRFNWNIQCENAREDLIFAKTDRSVIIEKLIAPNLTLISPNISETISPLAINVSSPDNLTSCNFSINSGPMIPMTMLNNTYYFGNEYYLRNGANSVDVYCVGDSSRTGIVSRNFNFIASLSSNVKHGSASIPDGQSIGTVLEITDYLANAFLIFSIRTTTSTPSQIQIQGILNKDNITFSRYSTLGDVFIEWSIVESPNIYVNRGVLPFAISDLSVSTSIENFNLSESFIIYSKKLLSSTTTENVRGFLTSEFSGANSILFERDQSGSSGEISWQTIEWDGSFVQSGKTLFSGSTGTTSLPFAVDLKNSFVVSSGKFGSGAIGLDETNVQTALTVNSVDFSRTGITGNPTMSWFVVESLEFNAQSGTNPVSGGGIVNQNINQTNSSKSFLLKTHTNTGAGTTYANARLTGRLSNDTNLEFRKGTTAQTNDVFWQVIEIGSSIIDFIILDVPQNKSYNSSTLDFSITTKLAATSCKYSLDETANVSMTLITPTSFTSNVQGLFEGNHTTIFYCTDSSSVEYKSDSILFEIDLTNPILTLNSPIDNYNASTNEIEFNFTASDNFGIQECSLYLNGQLEAINQNIQNNSIESISTFVPNGINDWYITCLDNSKRSVVSETRTINISGLYSIPWNNRLYESSTLNFIGTTPDIDLVNSRDLIENYLSVNLTASSLTDVAIPLTSYLGNNGMQIPAGTVIDFSSYIEVDSVNVIYITWKLYFENSSREDNLICQSGDDSIGGTRISSLSSTVTSNCNVANELILKNSDKFKLIISAYNDAPSNISFIHKWDGLRLSFVEFSTFNIIGQLYTDFTYPITDKIMPEEEYDNFTCDVTCSIGQCSNVGVTLQYLNGTEWLEVGLTNPNLIFTDGFSWRGLGTINQGTVSQIIPIQAGIPGNIIPRCYASYQYGEAKGLITPSIDIIKVPDAAYINPTPPDATEVGQDFIPINISINETDLQSVILEFNGVNQTLFNSSIVLGYNLDREEFRGENDTRVESFTGGIGGTIYGANYTTGYENLALEFDGVNDYIQTDSSLTPVLGSTSTLSFWVKTTQTGDDIMWRAPGVTGIEEAGGGNDIFIGWLDSTGRIGYTVANSAAVKSTVPINDGTWKHIIISRYANNGSSKIYINGDLNQQAISYIGDITLDYYSFGRIEDTGGTPEYFNGSFDKFVVYDRVISDTEAEELYSGQRIFFVNKTSLINDAYTFTTYAKNYYGGTKKITRTVTTKFGDTIAPQLTIVGINDSTSYTINNFNIDIYLDEFTSSCEYSLDAALAVSMNWINNTHYDTVISAVSEGSHTIEFSCRDSSNNENLTTYTFTVDTIAPTVTFESLTPPDGASRASDNVIIDAVLVESNLQEWNYTFNGSNYTIFDKSLISLIGLDNLAAFSEDANTIYDYISGAAGNVNGASYNSEEGHDSSGAFQFNSLNSEYISMGTPYNFVGKNITLLTWVKTSSISSEESIISFDDSFGSTILSIGHAAGSNFLSVVDPYGRHQTTSILADNNWHQVGFTFVNSTNVSIIFDGKVVSTFTTDTTLPSDLQFSLGMGYNGATPSYFFNGFIDEVRIYDKILNEVELDTSFTIDIYKRSVDNYYFKTNSNWKGGYYGAQSEGAWFDQSLDSRKDVTISNAGTTDLINFPIYLELISNYTKAGNYYDLKFVNGSCSEGQSLQLAHNVEDYNSSIANVWVNIPKLPSSGTTICMYYGDALASNSENETGTWNSDYGLVYHMNSTGHDSTSNTRDRTLVVGSPTQIDSFLGYEINLTGSDAWSLADIAYMEQEWSVRSHEIVFETSSDINTRQVLLSEGGTVNGIMMYILNGQLYARWWSESTGWAGAHLNTSITANQKYYAVMSYENPGNYELYLNGSRISSVATTSLISAHSGNGGIGYTNDAKDFHDLLGGTGYYFMGSITEFRVTDKALTSDEIYQTYKMIFDQSINVNFGSKQNVGGGLINGVYTYYSSAIDISGLSGSTETRTITIKDIDGTAPTLSLNLPLDSVIAPSSSYNFNWTATDNLDSTFNCDLHIGSNVFSGISTANNTLTNYLASGLGDGPMIWRVSCTDSDLNVGYSLNRTVTISEPPTVSLNDANNSFLSGAVTYTPNDNTGLDSCSLMIEGSVFDTISFITSGSPNTFDINPLGDGKYRYSVNCTDTFSLQASSEERILFKDSVAPNLTIAFPLNSSTVYNGNINFTFWLDDLYSSSAICNLTVDTILMNESVSVQIGSNYSLVHSLSSNNHTWDVSCIDQGGNQAVSGTYEFENFAAPQISLDSPENNIWLNSTDITFVYTPFDGAGIKNCSLYVDSVLTGTNTSIQNGVANSFTKTLTEATHNWSIKCFSTFDLEGSSETRILSIDSVPPNLVAHYPVGDEIFDWNDVFFNFTYTDNLDSVGNCEILIDGFSEASILANNNTVSSATIYRGDGNYSWNIKCTDEANNSAVTALKNFSVIAPPEITAISPANNTFTINSSINFTYQPRDASGLTQCEIFFDGVSAGVENNVANDQPNIFTINGIIEGSHTWNISCTDADLNKAWIENSIITRDITPPIIVLNAPMDGQGIDANNNVLFNWTGTDILDSFLPACSLIIDGIINKTVMATSGYPITESVSGLSIGTHYWNVTCEDQAGNFNTSEIRSFDYSYPDLMVNESSLVLSSFSPVEGEVVQINATIHNIGAVFASNIDVEFYLGDPSSGGVKIGSTQNINLNANNETIVSANWNAIIGISDIYVVVDRLNLINENNETNNKVFSQVTVSSWHFFYGDINTNSGFTLSDSSNYEVNRWNITDFTKANIYVTDYDSNIDWLSLQAIGRNINNNPSNNDIAEIDTVLGSTLFPDSLDALYMNGTVINETLTYSVFGNTINNVPVTTSIISQNFKTGILWDTSDDSNTEYDTEKEDIIFVTKINQSTQGSYEVVDYEMRVPALLRIYDPTNDKTAVFYVEVN